MAFEVIKSKYQRPKIAADGYIYIKESDRRSSNYEDRTYWKCAQYTKHLCKARLVTSGTEIVKRSGEHSHGGDAAKIEACKALEKLKEAALAEPEANPSAVVDEILAKLDKSTSYALPDAEKLKRLVRRSSRRMETVGPPPKSLDDLTLPGLCKKTLNGENFVLFDSGAGDPERIIILATAQNLAILQTAVDWYADVSFGLNNIFSQLYTIHVYCDGQCLSVIYGLLPNTTANTYKRFYQALSTEAQVEPRSIMVDYDTEAIEAIKTIFPNTEIRGCFYHFCQEIWKQIQIFGLQERYNSDGNWALRVRHLIALAFVPSHRVADVYESITDDTDGIIPVEAADLVNYFEATWIGSWTKKSVRSCPTFPINMWNVHSAVLEDHARLNNVREGWPRGFQGLLKPTASLWSLINNGIKKQQAITDKVYARACSKPPQIKKIKWTATDRKVKAICTTWSDAFGASDILNYLEQLAADLKV